MRPNSGRLWVHPGCPGGAPEVPQMYPKGALLTLTSARTYPFEVSQSPLEGTLRSPNSVLPLEVSMRPNFGKAKFGICDTCKNILARTLRPIIRIFGLFGNTKLISEKWNLNCKVQLSRWPLLYEPFALWLNGQKIQH